MPAGMHSSKQLEADILLPVLHPAGELPGDRGYDSDRFREGLRERGIEPAFPDQEAEIPLV